jgi:predicted dehydrogenase
MGREFASAAARWCHLLTMNIKPEITAICDVNLPESTVEWFTSNFPSIKQVTRDYREVTGSSTVDAIYCAVPHHLHEEIYCAVLEAGKHLMGEKPFGIDRNANEAIIEMARKNPHCFVRCSSEFPFFPGVQRLCGMIERSEFGTIIEVESGFLHSGDLDPMKPINWKRMVQYNGEYGCMGDLGMHVCHVPFRAGWIPVNVRAVLSNIVAERPDYKGGVVPCETWDNATLFCEVESQEYGRFPLTMKTQRIAPGEKNTWYLSVLGTRASARFSTKNPKLLQVLRYAGGEQVWQTIDIGYEPAFKTVTGGIFEFGFTDSILQMWAAFLYELKNKKPLRPFAGCATPEETALSHKLFTAALESHKQKTVVKVM